MVVSKATGRLAVLAVGLRRERGYQVTGRAVDRTRVALLAVSHAVDDIYQGAVPALLPFFIADRHYSYAAATGLTFAATVMSSVIQPAFGALTDRRNRRWLVPVGLDGRRRRHRAVRPGRQLPADVAGDRAVRGSG